ncbi:MAG: hypothetical protein J7J82_04630 [Staphylothermus sp.]|nr:hypothetical protein [Staphylothermus sp.]
MPIRIRGPGGEYVKIDLSKAMKAIETVKSILDLLVIGPIIMHRGPEGDVHIDIPLVYDGVALDRIHYDPLTDTFSPKGRPVHIHIDRVDLEHIRENANKMLQELRVLDAAEYREPERCWAIPLAWKTYIVAQVKVDVEGEELVPDYGLTAELGGRVVK